MVNGISFPWLMASYIEVCAVYKGCQIFPSQMKLLFFYYTCISISYFALPRMFQLLHERFYFRPRCVDLQHIPSQHRLVFHCRVKRVKHMNSPVLSALLISSHKRCGLVSGHDLALPSIRPI